MHNPRISPYPGDILVHSITGEQREVVKCEALTHRVWFLRKDSIFAAKCSEGEWREWAAHPLIVVRR